MTGTKDRPRPDTGAGEKDSTEAPPTPGGEAGTSPRAKPPARDAQSADDADKAGRFSRRRDRKRVVESAKVEQAEGSEEDLPDLGTIEDPLELRETASWLREELVATRIENTEHLDHLLRIKAEFDNYRKRMLREQSDVVARAARSLVESLLPVLDSFDLAMGHPPEDLDDDDTFLQGVKAVRTQIFDILDKEGLERIEPESGADFDPTVHEPVSHAPGDGDTQKVAGVLRPGYRFKGRLLRPAMVEVGG